MNLLADKACPIYQRSTHAVGRSAPPIGCTLDLPGLPGGGNKVYDRSPYGNHGTITGAVWRRLPSGLWYLDFDGMDDWVNCGTASNMIFTARFTLMAWVNVDEVEQGTQGVLTRRVGVYDGYQLNVTGAEASAWASDGSTWKSAYSGSMISVGSWYHLVATFDNTLASANLCIYVNGVLRGSTDTTITISCTGSSPVKLGTTYIGGIYYTVEGGIALPRIYNRALSALEIQNHYQREKYLFGVV